MSAGQDQLLILILTSLGVIFIPLLVLLTRIITKWTKIESRLDELTSDIAKLVVDKDKTHNEIINQIIDDRRATDKRLRWLEENVWNRKT